MAQNQMQRPVLGQWADLGDLYDARTDTFVSRSLLTGQAPETAINVTKHQTRQIRLLTDDSYKAKLSNMKVGTELGASFMSGMINVAGAAEYLKETRSNTSVEQASIHYAITTVEERLSIASPELRPYLTLDPIPGSGATHVLVGIVWGAQTIVTVKHQLAHESERDKFKRHVEDEFRRVEYAITTGASAGPGYHDDYAGRDMPSDITVRSDLISEAGHTNDLKRASNVSFAHTCTNLAMSFLRYVLVRDSMVPSPNNPDTCSD